MKIVLGALMVLVLMIGARPLIQNVLANQANTEQEAGVAKDAQGRTCDFGPAQDECPNASNSMPPGSKSASGDNVTGFAILPPGQHYGQCEEVGKNNELGCDVVKESDLPVGYQQGLEDAKNQIIPGDVFTNH